MLKSILNPIKEYVRANNIFKTKPKYIFRDNPYAGLLIITSKDYRVIMKYCMVNNHYMEGDYEKYDKTDKEIVFTFK